MFCQTRSCGAYVKTFRLSNPALALSVAAALFCGSAQSLEVGFEGLLAYELQQNTDNINIDDGTIPDSRFATGMIGVYGEQRSRSLSAGFSGEIETQRDLEDNDGGYETDTRFVGALDIAITPRAVRWYVGDVLTGVRNEDAVLIADDFNQDTVNVFVTGPSYQSEIPGVSSTAARLYYVHQSEDDEEVQSLYNFNVSHQRDTRVGSFYGIRFNDIFTSVAQDPNLDPAMAGLEDDDFNRMSLSVFTNRAQEYSDLYAEIGATRYTTDNDNTEGLTAALRATRRLGPRTRLTAGLTHSLNDQTLNTIEALFRGDEDDAGLQAEVDGIFAETRLDVNYAIEKPTSELSMGISIAQLDYQLLTGNASQNILVDGEDREQGSLNITYSKNYTNRLQGVFAAVYEIEEYQNRLDNSDAISLAADLIYTLSSSLNLELSIAHDTAEGLNTRGTNENTIELMFDEAVTRASIGIRWLPPSRASRELTIELNSLLD